MNQPAIRREVLVSAIPSTAFELFTNEIGAWWPLAQFSVYGEAATVAFEGDGRIVERSPAGESNCWGSVTVWEPPNRLGFTWHPGNRPAPSEVTVTFEPHGEQTLVVLEHGGWESFADPAGARDEYGRGWPVVLGRYAAQVTQAAAGEDPKTATWAALLHRPGSQAPAGEALFEHPLFGEHVAFLNQMRNHGYLVAAGPLTDQPGAGMTILRLPGPDRLPEAIRLATEDDASVVAGFFAVTVRPWQVILA